jgi:hypothetical protein
MCSTRVGSTLALSDPLVNYRRKKFLTFVPGVKVENFFFEVTDKLACLHLSSFSCRSIFAFRPRSLSVKLGKICCHFGPKYTCFQRTWQGKHSSLFTPAFSNREKSFLTLISVHCFNTFKHLKEGIFLCITHASIN